VEEQKEMGEIAKKWTQVASQRYAEAHFSLAGRLEMVGACLKATRKQPSGTKKQQNGDMIRHSLNLGPCIRQAKFASKQQGSSDVVSGGSNYLIIAPL
jgi:hypothetical protein